MTLVQEISDALVEIGTDFKEIDTRTGDLGDLTTVATSSLVAAINEVKAAVGAGSPTTLDDLTDVAVSSPATGHILRHNGTSFVNVLGSTWFQPADADLDALVALNATNYGRAFLELANQSGLMALIQAASESVAGKVELATTGEATTGTDTERAVTPAGVKAAIDAFPAASETVQGKVELATTGEAAAGTDTARAVTPAGLAAHTPTASETAQGKVELATTGEATTGTDTARATTPAGVKAHFDSRIDTNVALGSSNTQVPSQAAVKAYADALIAANDAMVFKGVIDASTNPNYPAADKGDTYKISVAGKIGGASGPNVGVGDVIISTADGQAAGTHAAVGANWAIIEANIDGAVTGPASSTAGNLPTFSGTTGKVIQDSGFSPSNAAIGAGSATVIPTTASVKTYVDAVRTDMGDHTTDLAAIYNAARA